MTITVGELWDSLRSYPLKLNYYDMNKNEEDCIITATEMVEFICEYRNYAVDEFSIYADESGFKVDLTIEKRRKK